VSDDTDATGAAVVPGERRSTTLERECAATCDNP
jgi:hypothetical protein